MQLFTRHAHEAGLLPNSCSSAVQPLGACSLVVLIKQNTCSSNRYLITRRVPQAGLLAGTCEQAPASAPRTHQRRSTAVYLSRTTGSPCRSSPRTPLGSPASQRDCRKMQRSTQGRRCLLAADDPMDRIPTHYSQNYRLTYIHED